MPKSNLIKKSSARTKGTPKVSPKYWPNGMSPVSTNGRTKPNNLSAYENLSKKNSLQRAVSQATAARSGIGRTSGSGRNAAGTGSISQGIGRTGTISTFDPKAKKTTGVTARKSAKKKY